MPWRKWKTGMKTDAEIRQAGMQVLIQALGTIETERFFAALSRDRFDYTEWVQVDLVVPAYIQRFALLADVRRTARDTPNKCTRFG
jgi:hypothetical protein